MKIKRFDETLKNKLTLDFIKECFIILFDNSDLDPEVIDNVPDENYFSIGFDIPIGKIGEIYDIEKLSYIGDSVGEFFNEIALGIEKIKIEFPKIFIDVVHNEYGNYRTTLEHKRNMQYITINFSLD